MHQISAIRFQQMRTLEAERVSVYRGMSLLIDAIGHLTRNYEPSPERARAEQILHALTGEAEDRNKALSQESGDLWRLVLELDGQELTSREITAEQSSVASSEQLLERVRRRLGQHLTAGKDVEGDEPALMLIGELARELRKRGHELWEAQEKYQRSRAEAVASRLLSAYVN